MSEQVKSLWLTAFSFTLGTPVSVPAFFIFSLERQQFAGSFPPRERQSSAFAEMLWRDRPDWHLLFSFLSIQIQLANREIGVPRLKSQHSGKTYSLHFPSLI
jgi:hypothetical protein